ncbi:MAG TPA: hypothetical protein VMQ65_01375 [Candidatus Limnocylindria bacterium]|nr:hypothetical protein [Candidatus Limnocylindria bacterium]
METGDRPAEAKELDLGEFMNLLPYLEAAELMAVSAAYQQADAVARAGAREAASAGARKVGLIDELSRLHSSIIQWAGADVSPTSAFTMEGLRTNPMLGDIRVQAVPALLDTATALLLKDGLSADDRAVLLEPIGAAVG